MRILRPRQAKKSACGYAASDTLVCISVGENIELRAHMMPRKASITVAGVLWVMSQGSGLAQKSTEEQKTAAIENLAFISTAKRWCDDYQIDVNTTVEAALRLVDITVEPYKSRFLAERQNAERLASNAGTKVYCMAAYKIYGPDGMGLMMRK